MESNDCITKDCSSIYRFQFASIAFLCSVYLPFTFHSTIWPLYAQSFEPVNCTVNKPSFVPGSSSTSPTRLRYTVLFKNQNHSTCCPCYDILNGNVRDKRLWALCRTWMAHNIDTTNARKETIVDEWDLACGQENRKHLTVGSISFLIAEALGAIVIGILADHYGRKIMLLLCLYIPVLFGSLAAFTTTYPLFLVLRWPVGFLNKGLLLLVFIMVIESCEYKHRAQIGSLLLASIPVFGIIIGVTYFFLLDWRHMQLLGTLVTTLTLCYPWLIPESRRWYVNSHRISRVNKLLQLCSSKQTPTLSLNNVGSPAPTTIIYDKPILTTDTLRVQAGTISSLLSYPQLRTITYCLFMLWFLTSFCYRSIIFPTILSHPTVNYVLMNATEFLSYIIALLVAYKIGRRAPLAVLILISGLSSVSLAISLLETGHTWLEIIFSLVARGCLRTCYCLLMLFTTELYPTSIRAMGLAIGLSSEVLAQIVVELLLYWAVDRLLLLFISGGVLCLSSCLIFPLPETLLYDIPDSLADLQSMKHTLGNENGTKVLSTNGNYHIIDSNVLTLPRVSESNTVTSDLNDLAALHSKVVVKPQLQAPQQEEVDGRSLTVRSQLDAMQLHSNNSTLRGLSNPSYFASSNDTIDQYDVEQQINSRVVISIRNALNNNQNNNNNNDDEQEFENTKF